MSCFDACAHFVEDRFPYKTLITQHLVVNGAVAGRG